MFGTFLRRELASRPKQTAMIAVCMALAIALVVLVAAAAAGIRTAQGTALQQSPGAAGSARAGLTSSMTGSLSTASSLTSSIGLWLSILALAAAFLASVLLTVSGVARRSRELGTLKAIGWSDGRVVRQVAGESFVQGLIGGAIGIVLGVGAILAVDAIHPTLTAALAVPGAPTAVSDVVLNLPVSPAVIVLAICLSVLGGLVAGASGGWCAARLRPADALRSAA